MSRTGILDPQTWNQVVYVLNELLSTVPEMKNSVSKAKGEESCWFIDSYGTSFFSITVLDDGVVLVSMHVSSMLCIRMFLW